MFTGKRKPSPFEVVYCFSKNNKPKTISLKAFWLVKNHLLCTVFYRSVIHLISLEYFSEICFNS